MKEEDHNSASEQALKVYGEISDNSDIDDTDGQLIYGKDGTTVCLE